MKKKTTHHRTVRATRKRTQTVLKGTSARPLATLVFMIMVVAVVCCLITLVHPSSDVLGAHTSSESFFARLLSTFTSFLPGSSQSAGNTRTNFTLFGSKSDTSGSGGSILTKSDLEKLADAAYLDGNLPLGDNKYVTDAPRKGYIYLCNVNKGKGGAGANVPWIHGTNWNYKEKSSISGKITWNNAVFSNLVSGSMRTITSNDLPINHTTGVYPVSPSDPAYAYDKNPNTITAQSFSQQFQVNPTYSETPHCMGGEVGIMTTGVALFNGFDAELRDAVAHEVQDSCSGHPERTGEYHYHGLSSCVTNTDVTHVIGFALDGFPITGPKVSIGKYLTTDDLDVCHGIRSEIMLDGKSVTMYHYVMTLDFPYSVSCFRGTPVSLMVGKQGGKGQQNMNQQRSQGSIQQSGMSTQHPNPPAEAFSVCSGQTAGASCSFQSPRGSISGTCQIPPGQQTSVCSPFN